MLGHSFVDGKKSLFVVHFLFHPTDTGEVCHYTLTNTWKIVDGMVPSSEDDFADEKQVANSSTSVLDC